MGTKNKPGKFDCYSHADPDEPMFVLLGRDPIASVLVGLWVKIRQEMGETNEEKLMESVTCASALSHWAHKLGKSDAVDAGREAYIRVIHRLIEEAVEGL